MSDEIFKKHYNKKTVLCGGQDCPFCSAGFPRRMTTPIFDFEKGTVRWITFDADSKVAEMLYGNQWNPRKEIGK